jgi:putative flippase GtrA
MTEAPPIGLRLRRLLVQGLKFGIVGGLATAVHLALFVLFIELAGMQPFWANFPAFAVAVVVSFTGHFLWTFRRRDREGAKHWTPALVKFAATAILGLLLNLLIVHGVVDVFALSYGYAAVLMATLTPTVVFTVSKFWAFA